MDTGKQAEGSNPAGGFSGSGEAELRETVAPDGRVPDEVIRELKEIKS